MAENINSERNADKGHRTKKSTRVDLTPMVDLGFLLITFFVFTTAMTVPKAMRMDTPHETDIMQDKICESCAITFIPAGNNLLFYYEGNDTNPRLKQTNYSPAGLRALLMKKKTDAAKFGRDAILIVKPAASSSFANLIDIIDESNICRYTRYYMDEINTTDTRMLSLMSNDGGGSKN